MGKLLHWTRTCRSIRFSCHYTAAPDETKHTFTMALARLACVLLAASGASAFAPARAAAPRARTQPAATSTDEIEVVRAPSREWLEAKGVFDWGTWGCGASTFPWTYAEAESCYLLEGDVTVTPADGRAPATFGAGDFVSFPAGMACTWDVRVAVKKHFLFF